MIEVSVVMAVFNESRYIAEAIQSILDQQDITLELLVVDDISTDNTRDIVEQFCQTDNRVRLIRNDKKGKVNAFNLGISQSKGEWVCIFAGDDIMPAGSLKDRHDAIREAGQAAPIVGLCRLITMSENKKFDGQVIPRNPNKPALSGVCFLMNRPSLDMIWPVPDVLPNEDTWMQLCAMYLDITFKPSGVIGCRYRIHGNNSINLRDDFSVFNPKYTIRMEAIALFRQLKANGLTTEAKAELDRCVRCEEARRRGDVWGIIRSRVALVEMLRSIALSRSWLYEVRRFGFRFFSGW